MMFPFTLRKCTKRDLLEISWVLYPGVGYIMPKLLNVFVALRGTSIVLVGQVNMTCYLSYRTSAF